MSFKMAHRLHAVTGHTQIEELLAGWFYHLLRRTFLASELSSFLLKLNKIGGPLLLMKLVFDPVDLSLVVKAAIFDLLNSLQDVGNLHLVEMISKIL